MNINSQRGAALIVVMFVLLLVAVVGSMAIRQSITGQNIATNSQVQSLLQQNTDAVFFAIEQDNKNQNLLERNLSSLGMLGMVKSDQFLSKEVVFCKERFVWINCKRLKILFASIKQRYGLNGWNNTDR